MAFVIVIIVVYALTLIGALSNRSYDVVFWIFGVPILVVVAIVSRAGGKAYLDQRRKQRALETLRHQAQSLIRDRPELLQFVMRHFNEENPWPQEITFSQRDIEALGFILAERGSPVSESVLNAALSDALVHSQYSRFLKAFSNARPDIERKLADKQAAQAEVVASYVAMFGGFTPVSFDQFFRQRLLQAGLWSADDKDMPLRIAIENAQRSYHLSARVEHVTEALKGGRIGSEASLDQVDLMSGIEFEDFVARLFRAMTAEVSTTPVTRDQGADLILRWGGKQWAVQVKRSATMISNSAIQEAVAACSFYRCEQAMVVTNSMFTPAAVELAVANGVTLWDRQMLAQQMRQWL